MDSVDNLCYKSWIPNRKGVLNGCIDKIILICYNDFCRLNEWDVAKRQGDGL